MRRIFNYFSLNQRERLAIIGLLILFFVFLTTSVLLPMFQQSHGIAYQRIQWEGKLTRPAIDSIGTIPATTMAEKKPITYFYFDPNVLQKAEWIRLGLREKQAQVILNYVHKGGRFYQKEDLFKIYSLSKQEVERLIPYVRIEEPATPKKSNAYNPPLYIPIKTPPPILIDINLADSLAFEMLHGIGPSFARRIVNYRQALGGFYSIQQLKEVYGIPAELIDKLSTQLNLQADNIQKIAINHWSVEELGKHPYLKYKRARLIVAYRNQHGSFQSIADLKHIHSLDDDFFVKIEPYLDFSL